jgi:PIN domain nuclease of toxin-antitoxin system
VKLLLDTHALVWIIEAPALVSKQVRSLVMDPGNTVLVSAASGWEIATKVRLGKMVFDETFLDAFDARVQNLGFEPLGVTAEHAVTGARLTGVHRDPFDRLLAGQAFVEQATLVSRDPAMPALGVTTVW